MKLVIDIDEEIYKDIMIHNREMREGGESAYYFEELIQNGTPLPKGHGRLIDGDEIASKIDGLKDNWNRCGNEYESGRYEGYDYAVDEIVDAPTIIEADKEN